MAWFFLSCAIVVEVLATTFLAWTQEFTRPWPTAAVLAGYGLAFFLLSKSLKDLEVGVAYAIWAGLGTALVAIIGIVFSGETLTVVKATGILLVIVGAVLLNLHGTITPTA
jgi:small multidrug resistance pump